MGFGARALWQLFEGVLTPCCCWATWLPMAVQRHRLEPKATLGAWQVRFCPLGYTLVPAGRRVSSWREHTACTRRYKVIRNEYTSYLLPLQSSCLVSKILNHLHMSDSMFVFSCRFSHLIIIATP